MKLLSICVPTFNRSLFLNALLSSLKLNLSRMNNVELAKIEVLITDNASSDGTPDSIRTVFEELSSYVDVRYIRHEKNLGMVGNWNSFLRESRGQFIIWYPDDDIIIDNNHLQKILTIISEDQNAEIIFGHHVRGYSLPGELDIVRQSEYCYEMPDVVDEKFVFNYFWSGFYPNYAAFNRKDVLDAGGFPDSTALDMELIFKMLLRNPEKLNYYTGEAGAIWRLHEGSESETFLTDKTRNVTFIDSMQRVYEYASIVNYPDINFLRKCLQRMCIEYIFRLVRIKKTNIFLLGYARRNVQFCPFIVTRFVKHYLIQALRKLLRETHLLTDKRYIKNDQGHLLIKLPWSVRDER